MFTWDGKDTTGKTVSDEAYLYILEAVVDGALAESTALMHPAPAELPAFPHQEMLTRSEHPKDH